MRKKAHITLSLSLSPHQEKRKHHGTQTETQRKALPNRHWIKLGQAPVSTEPKRRLSGVPNSCELKNSPAQDLSFLVNKHYVSLRTAHQKQASQSTINQAKEEKFNSERERVYGGEGFRSVAEVNQSKEGSFGLLDVTVYLVRMLDVGQ